MRIVIVGLGSTGMELARTLIDKRDNEIVLIDINEDTTETVSEEFDAVTVTGDASNPEILRQAKLEEADALIAVTDSDAINLVIAMIARQWDVKKIAIKLTRASLRPAGREIIEDIIVVMPHASAANAIVQSIYGKERSNIAEAIGGALYQETVEVEEDGGRKIEELDLPEDCLVIALRREGDVMLARAETRIEKGDTLIILAENEDSIEKIKI